MTTIRQSVNKISDNDSYDITSGTFLNNKDFVKYLTINKWPEFWSSGGTTPSLTNLRYPSNPKGKGSDIMRS